MSNNSFFGAAVSPKRKCEATYEVPVVDISNLHGTYSVSRCN
jgi:hypothetical protein